MIKAFKQQELREEHHRHLELPEAHHQLPGEHHPLTRYQLINAYGL
jgi:hypothetical protein